MSESREQLRQFIEKHCLITDQAFILSAGKSAEYYFDCKRATLDGAGLVMIAEEFLNKIEQINPRTTAIAGLTMGADPIVAAVVMRASQLGLPTNRASIVRKEPKQHGTRSHIENDQAQDTVVIVVDDVITSGRSTQIACDKLIEAKYKISGIICLVDREEGGVAMLKEKYHCPVSAVFCRRDFKAITTSL